MVGGGEDCRGETEWKLMLVYGVLEGEFLSEVSVLIVSVDDMVERRVEQNGLKGAVGIL